MDNDKKKLRRSWVKGVIDYDIIELLDSIEEETSEEFDKQVEIGLLDLGYKIKKNYKIDNRGDGYRGIIDFVVDKNNKKAAIQLDRTYPREKNIYKVKRVPEASMKLVYCRFS